MTPAPAAAAAHPGFVGWLTKHPYEAALGGLGSVVAIALYLKSKKSSTTSTPPSYAYPAGTATTIGTDLLGLEETITALKVSIGTAGKGTSTTPKPTSSGIITSGLKAVTPGAGAAVGGPSLGTTALAGSDFFILGGFQPTGKYTGWNVTDGAPVDFTWTGQGTPEQGAPPPGAKGVVAYTPTSTPESEIGTHTDTVPNWAKGYTGTG